VLKAKDMFGRFWIGFGLLEKARTGKKTFFSNLLASNLYFVKVKNAKDFLKPYVVL